MIFTLKAVTGIFYIFLDFFAKLEKQVKAVLWKKKNKPPPKFHGFVQKLSY